jgi:hypothetical protein
VPPSEPNMPPIEDAKRLSRELSELLAGVDIIGLRAFGPNPRRTF